jgi:hypothetical protein
VQMQIVSHNERRSQGGRPTAADDDGAHRHRARKHVASAAAEAESDSAESDEETRSSADGDGDGAAGGGDEPHSGDEEPHSGDADMLGGDEEPPGGAVEQQSDDDVAPTLRILPLSGDGVRFEAALRLSLDVWRGEGLVTGHGKTMLDVISTLLNNQVSGKKSDADVERDAHGWASICPGAERLPIDFERLRAIVQPQTPEVMDVDACNVCGAAYLDAAGRRDNRKTCPNRRCLLQTHFKVKANGDGAPAYVAFRTVDCKHQLRLLMLKPALSSLMWTEEPRTDGLIASIQDGSNCQRINALLHAAAPGQRFIRLAVSLDGVSPYGMNWTSYSCWPVLLELLDLPSDVRRLPENMILVALSYGPHCIKDVQSMLGEVVIRLNAMFDNGVEIVLGHLGTPVMVRPVVLYTIADGPGLCDLMGLYGVGAKCGCPYCMLQTKARSGGGSGRVFADGRRFLPLDHPLRTDAQHGEPEERGAPLAKTPALLAAAVENIQSAQARAMMPRRKLCRSTMASAGLPLFVA